MVWFVNIIQSFRPTDIKDYGLNCNIIQSLQHMDSKG